MAYKIYLSPSDQYANVYPVGNTNEAEQCNRIANFCEMALERCGFEVRQNGNMYTAVRESNSWGADLHVPIHTNAFDTKVAGTRIFCFALAKADGSDTEGCKAAKAIFETLAPLTPGESENVKAAPQLYEVKNTTAPCAYVEVDFHDVPAVAEWIIDNAEQIAEKICEGICEYFGVEYVASDKPETVEPTGEVRYSVLLGNWKDRTAAEDANEHLGGNGVVAIGADGKVGGLV